MSRIVMGTMKARRRLARCWLSYSPVQIEVIAFVQANLLRQELRTNHAAEGQEQHHHEGSSAQPQ